MLHHCLSAEHVLVGENQVCKVTGFGIAENILEREDYERENGVSGWLFSLNTLVLLRSKDIEISL
jgi:hypothetical protein